MSCLLLQTLSQQFPESDWIVAQAAVAQYNLRNFDDAQELFEDLIERDPHRIEVRFTPFHYLLAWQCITAQESQAAQQMRCQASCILCSLACIKLASNL